MIELEDLLDLFVESEWQRIKIFDISVGEEIYDGMVADVPDEIKDEKNEVQFLDIIENNILTINVL